LAEFKAVIYNNIVIGLQALLIKLKSEGDFENLPPEVQVTKDLLYMLAVRV